MIPMSVRAGGYEWAHAKINGVNRFAPYVLIVIAENSDVGLLIRAHRNPVYKIAYFGVFSQM